MAYFLKKSNLKKGLYLQIYESFYDSVKKQTAHRSYKALGYADELIKNGIDNPIEFYSDEVRKLNQALKENRIIEKTRLITDSSPEKLLGYFPLKNINDSLHCRKYFDMMQSSKRFRFSVYDLMSALIYSRVVSPSSKCRTFEEVIPRLFEKYDFSMDQMYSALEYIGLEYEKIIEIYNHQIALRYRMDTSSTYFDCTNFYFEIDREDDFRKKGPSKENRKAPIVGMGLLLDRNQIPVGMKLYPGNESEKPVLKNIIDDLKIRNNIKGRTVRIADKGLNCINNILHAVSDGDGYIFSKSVKMLQEKEKQWVLLNNDYKDVKDSSKRLMYRVKSCIDKFEYTYTDTNGKKRKIKLKEKRIVTYNPRLAEKQIFEINKQVEKARNLRASEAKRSEYGDSSKYVSFIPADSKGVKTEGRIVVEINTEAIEKAKELAGYNMIVTSETKMTDTEIYDAYHNLWRIEESFRVMKSQLEARPVYLQKKETITGHFLICYLAVVLTRLLQIKVLGDKYSTEAIFKFMHEFRVAQVSDRKYVNLSTNTEFTEALAAKTFLPLKSYFLNNDDIKMMLSYRF